MEGKNYLLIDGKKIDERSLETNYDFWVTKLGIPEDIASSGAENIVELSKMNGSHTFPYKVVKDNDEIIPLFKIFGFDTKRGEFIDHPTNGLISDSIRKGDGAHMGTARELGLDKFVFSYLGTHLPYHRIGDPPPIFPFGLFVKPQDFAFTHCSPCDRDYKANDFVDKDNIDKYFVTFDKATNLITHLIQNDDLFKNDVWEYYGNPSCWKNEDYRNFSWKKKVEICFFEKVGPENISAILWPVWEEYYTDSGVQNNDLFDLIDSFKSTYNIHTIIYRPYGAEINKDNWTIAHRDWESNLIEASFLSQRYKNELGEYPDSVLTAREFFNSK